jgi:hypothetical protein
MQDPSNKNTSYSPEHNQNNIRESKGKPSSSSTQRKFS